MAGPVHIYISCLRRHYGPPPMPPVHTRRHQNDEPTIVKIPLEPEHPSIVSLAATQRVTPGTADYHTTMLDPLLRMGILVSLAIATVFLGAKYYFDRQVVHDNHDSSTDAKLNVVVVAAVFTACVCGWCALSMCCAESTPRQACAARAARQLVVQGTPGSTASHV